MIKDTSFIINHINMSLVTQKEMQRMYSLLQKYNVTLTQITPGQRLVLFGIEDREFQHLLEEIDNIFNANGSEIQNPDTQITSLRCCPDPDQCNYCITSSKKLGRKLSRLIFSKPFPHKVKIGISACSMCCTEPLVRDVGLIATRKGWKVFFGGNGGGKPRIADLVASDLTQEEAVNIVEKLLVFYTKSATKKQRTARFVETLGIDRIKKNISK